MNSDHVPIFAESIELINDLGELERLDQKFHDLLASEKIDEKTLFYLNLIGDELITNIISYGYEDDGEHVILLNIVITLTHWTLEIRDDGRAFNPLMLDKPERSLSIEERPLGGWGIHFVKQVMDEISYERNESYNILKLKKLTIHGNEA